MVARFSKTSDVARAFRPQSVSPSSSAAFLRKWAASAHSPSAMLRHASWQRFTCASGALSNKSYAVFGVVFISITRSINGNEASDIEEIINGFSM